MPGSFPSSRRGWVDKAIHDRAGDPYLGDTKLGGMDGRSRERGHQSPPLWGAGRGFSYLSGSGRGGSSTPEHSSRQHPSRVVTHARPFPAGSIAGPEGTWSIRAPHIPDLWHPQPHPNILSPDPSCNPRPSPAWLLISPSNTPTWAPATSPPGGSACTHCWFWDPPCAAWLVAGGIYCHLPAHGCLGPSRP